MSDSPLPNPPGAPCAAPGYARWEHGERQRYYEFRRLQDLWGAWSTVTTWGRIGTSLGRQVSSALANADAVDLAFSGIARRRVADGYLLVASA
ncbi:WGR domain-containing protein [Pseudorhodoferax sp. Leaf265]|jgi:hypothetical protein|uniref:WGR domain-containing protein n=1 Tax=Pseudorhodoferax sp. Leaf265 TaxID=1736315 RepID=UPI0012E713B7|nr:WGR domain-containing protein [Pseudorhodoferax sp. Leaf265]